MKKFLYLIATDQINGGAIFVLKGFLWIVSKVYGALIGLRGVFYKVGLFKYHNLSVPVVSVGNLTVGGVGKTPLVEFIARMLKENGVQPVVLMRGYMDQGLDGQGQKSDEAAMLRNMLSDIPVLIGADRVKNAEAFSKENKADIFLLDDGFQHWRISRQLDIVVIDVTDPWGNGHLLPRGILREPKNALLRGGIFVLTKTDFGAENLEALKQDLGKINSKALIIETIHKPVSLSDLCSGEDLDLSLLKAQKIIAVCGIGSPESFMKTLTKLDAEIDRQVAFMDHHCYEKSDTTHIVKLCQDTGVSTVVITEKDAVKLKFFVHMFPDNIRVLSLKIKISIISGEDQFLERINRIL